MRASEYLGFDRSRGCYMGKKVTVERAPSFKVDYYVSRLVYVCV